MVQEALPNATVSNNWDSITGGASAHLVLDDPVGSPDDDTTKIGTNTQGDTCRVNIDSLTDPEVGTGHILHFRANCAGSGAKERIQIKLFEGSTERAASGNIQCTRGSWADFSYTLDELTEADNIADYTDLRIEVIAVVLGGGETLEVTQCYLEVPDAPVGGVDEKQFMTVLRDAQQRKTAQEHKKLLVEAKKRFFRNTYFNRPTYTTWKTLIPDQVDVSHDTDTLVKAAIDVTHTTDTLVKVVDNDLTHTTDVLVFQEVDLTHTTDILVHEHDVGRLWDEEDTSSHWFLEDETGDWELEDDVAETQICMKFYII